MTSEADARIKREEGKLTHSGDLLKDGMEVSGRFA
jgi:hypothetical protein